MSETEVGKSLFSPKAFWRFWVMVLKVVRVEAAQSLMSRWDFLLGVVKLA
jgi:hypothetical protein